MAISSSSDPDLDALIAELAASLAPGARNAFEVAARDVLRAAGCSGVGAGSRHWDPPSDDMRREGARHLRPSKLQNLPAVGTDDPRCGARDRHRLRAG